MSSVDIFIKYIERDFAFKSMIDYIAKVFAWSMCYVAVPLSISLMFIDFID